MLSTKNKYIVFEKLVIFYESTRGTGSAREALVKNGKPIRGVLSLISKIKDFLKGVSGGDFFGKSVGSFIN